MQAATCDCWCGLLFQSGRRSVANKVFLRATGSQLFFFSIPMRVDRGIDREETAVAAVSERYRGDNVLGVETSPTGSAATIFATADSWTCPADEISCDASLFKRGKEVHKMFMLGMLQHFLRGYNESRIRLKRPIRRQDRRELRSGTRSGSSLRPDHLTSDRTSRERDLGSHSRPHAPYRG
jgi:hypothetical protein